MSLGQALADSAPLAGLALRIRESNARFASLGEALPAALRPHVKPGPVDTEGWALLAANASVAVKLRHLAPRLDAALLEAGWPPVLLRIRVQPA